MTQLRLAPPVCLNPLIGWLVNKLLPNTHTHEETDAVIVDSQQLAEVRHDIIDPLGGVRLELFLTNKKIKEAREILSRQEK